jgi:thiol-disulfide isomerase/thioredoxin
MTATVKVVGLVALMAAVAWLSYQVKREVRVAVLESLEVGDPAPDFTLEDLHGEGSSLADHRGRVVVLNFWTTRCPQRRLGMPLLDQFYEEHRDSGAIVLNISLREGRERIQDVLKGSECLSPVLLDVDGRTAAAYGLKYVPTLVMVNREGRIAWIGQGYLPDLGQVLARELKALGESASGKSSMDDRDLD